MGDDPLPCSSFGYKTSEWSFDSLQMRPMVSKTSFATVVVTETAIWHAFPNPLHEGVSVTLKQEFCMFRARATEKRMGICGRPSNPSVRAHGVSLTLICPADIGRAGREAMPAVKGRSVCRVISLFQLLLKCSYRYRMLEKQVVSLPCSRQLSFESAECTKVAIKCVHSLPCQ